LGVNLSASATNVGNTFRTIASNPSAIVGGFATLSSWLTPIALNGDAVASIQGLLNDASCNGFIACTANGSATITVPISLLPENPLLTSLLSPSTSDSWYWYFKNNWHHVTYYATAPSHAPSGAVHDCRDLSSLDCITVTGSSLPPDTRAILILTGRSLTGATRPNTNVADYLDTVENQNLNTTFEQRGYSRSFNDRFYSVSNY
jgi:hypothetical protein